MMVSAKGPQTNDELRDEVEFLGDVLSAVRAGPWELYPRLEAIYLSPTWAAMFGIEKPPNRFADYLALIDPSDRDRVASETERIFLLGEGDRWESRHRLAGRVVVSRAVLVRPNRVVGADIDVF